MSNNITEFTKFISASGEEYSFDTKDRFLMTESGMGLPPIKYITKKGPFQHGETVVDFRLQPRTIQLQLRQNSCSRADYWTNRSLLLNAIKPNNYSGNSFHSGVLRKIFDDGSIRDLNVCIEAGPIFEARSLDKWDEWGFTETLRFIAHDPVFYNPVRKGISWESITSSSSQVHWQLPFSFPMQFGETAYGQYHSIEYEGTWISYPIIVLTGPQNGTIITNISTGETIDLEYNIAAGRVVTIDLEPGNKTVTNDLGTNLIGVVTSDSDLSTFHIAPDPEVAGGLNEFSIQLSGATAASKMDIYYYEKFLGI